MQQCSPYEQVRALLLIIPVIKKVTIAMKPTKQRYRPFYNEGTCKQLKGKIGLVFIYLNDKESQWTDDDVNSIQSHLQTMQEFIMASAHEYKVYVDFTPLHIRYTHQKTPLIYPKKIWPYDATCRYKYNLDVLDTVAQLLSYTSTAAMHEDMQRKTGCTQVAYQILVNKSGRAYALLGEDTESLKNYIEHAILFSKYTKTDTTRYAGAYVHELLHLFGAEDLYRSKYRKAHAHLYPDDIMYTVRESIYSTKISNITAYSLGWHNNLPEILKAKRWWQ
jgi:hypothetical protein